MAAAAAALARGIEPREIERALADFADCRIELNSSHERGGVTYIDDSKGTNVGAVVEALDALRAPIILIAGGLDKGGDYAPLRGRSARRCKLLILIGAARDKMRAALEGATEIELVQTLDEAVARRGRGRAPRRHRAAVAGLLEFRSIQGLCGTWATYFRSWFGRFDAVARPRPTRGCVCRRRCWWCSAC